MSTDEMLIEIASYDYKCYGFPGVFLNYNKYNFTCWEIIWRNTKLFSNGNCIGNTPKEACEKALKFIYDNPNLFTK